MSAALEDRKILGIVYCPVCKEDTIPVGPGICGWCETRLTGDEAPAALKEDTPMPATCKIDGCTNPDAGKRGPWVGYCQHHISTAMSERNRKRANRTAKTAARPAAKSAPVPDSNNGSLVALAQAVEDAKHAYDQALIRLRQAIA